MYCKLDSKMILNVVYKSYKNNAENGANMYADTSASSSKETQGGRGGLLKWSYSRAVKCVSCKWRKLPFTPLKYWSIPVPTAVHPWLYTIQLHLSAHFFPYLTADELLQMRIYPKSERKVIERQITPFFSFY